MHYLHNILIFLLHKYHEHQLYDPEQNVLLTFSFHCCTNFWYFLVFCAWITAMIHCFSQGFFSVPSNKLSVMVKIKIIIQVIFSSKSTLRKSQSWNLAEYGRAGNWYHIRLDQLNRLEPWEPRVIQLYCQPTELGQMAVKFFKTGKEQYFDQNWIRFSITTGSELVLKQTYRRAVIVCNGLFVKKR